jgi:hypothetical protein
MGRHPSHWRTHIFQDGYCTTNQKPESSIISKHKPQNSAIYLIGGPTHLVHDGEDLMVS